MTKKPAAKSSPKRKGTAVPARPAKTTPKAKTPKPAVPATRFMDEAPRFSRDKEAAAPVASAAPVDRTRQKADQADRDRVALGLKQIGIARASIDVREKDIVIIFTRLQVPTMRVR